MERQQDKLRQQEGREVEEYAHGLFPNATQIIKTAPLDEILAQSRDAVSRPFLGKATFNPIIQAGDLVAELDILSPWEDGSFALHEVKSSTDVKDHYLPQIAFQFHVCQKAGIEISHAYLLTLNNRYIRQGAIDPKKLFAQHDVTEGVQSLDIGHQIQSALDVMAQTECPEIQIGAHCDVPHECPLKEVCWKNVNDHPCNVFTMTRMKGDEKWALFQRGIIENKDIPADYKLTPKQKIQIECERTGQMHVNTKGLEEFLGGLVYPLYFLDFETIALAIPLLNGTRPYEQIPFQFSLHKMETPDAEPWHYGWIWAGDYGEVHREFLTQLEMWLGTTGSIIAYNAKFEMGIMKMAAKIRPEFQVWLDGILERFVDLLLPFRNFLVYHPKQHGSASLKSVLPALTGQSYDHLQIRDGELAGWAFWRLLETKDEAEKNGIRAELERYCRLDTLGMVLILRELWGFVR